jgi:hypothetical protein
MTIVFWISCFAPWLHLPTRIEKQKSLRRPGIDRNYKWKVWNQPNRSARSRISILGLSETVHNFIPRRTQTSTQQLHHEHHCFCYLSVCRVLLYAVQNLWQVSLPKGPSASRPISTSATDQPLQLNRAPTLTQSRHIQFSGNKVRKETVTRTEEKQDYHVFTDKGISRCTFRYHLPHIRRRKLQAYRRARETQVFFQIFLRCAYCSKCTKSLLAHDGSGCAEKGDTFEKNGARSRI